MHRIKAGRLADEEPGAGERAMREDHAALGAMSENDLFAGAKELHLMFARDGAATERGETDRAGLARQPGP